MIIWHVDMGKMITFYYLLPFEQLYSRVHHLPPNPVRAIICLKFYLFIALFIHNYCNIQFSVWTTTAFSGIIVINAISVVQKYVCGCLVTRPYRKRKAEPKNQCFTLLLPISYAERVFYRNEFNFLTIKATHQKQFI